MRKEGPLKNLKKKNSFAANCWLLAIYGYSDDLVILWKVFSIDWSHVKKFFT